MVSKDNNTMILAAKCAPQESVLLNVCQAGIKAAELYLSKKLLCDVSRIAQICRNFPLCYAVHSANDCYAINELVELVNIIGAEIVVFHNTYWEDEWGEMVEKFKGSSAKLCIENIYSIHDPVKFMRRYGLERCLDLEHLQMECAGVFEEVFIHCISEATHIHLSGYWYGSSLWHTHIHHSPEHNRYMLSLLKKANYSGLVVSEAKVSLQTYAEFKKMRQFYEDWGNGR